MGIKAIFKTLKEELDIYLREYMKEKGTYNKRVYQAMEYSLNAGGKRIRPILFLLTYKLYNESHREVMDIAAAIEMIHTYSLIHDDLPAMDNDDLRRGKPTNHKVFGEAIAILGGDGLLNEAMNIMFRHCIGKGENVIKACSIISESAGVEGMIGGQTVDILSENTKISTDKLYYMHSRKTGAMIKGSIVSAAVYASRNEKEISKLEYYGEKLGLAFQIKDDILDVLGDTALLGKKTRSDLNNNKTTFVTVYGLSKCQEMCHAITRECMDVLDEISGDTSYLKELTLFLLNREK
ncbi:polyprenyl synthetase family protein [Clostridium sp. WILCCON 0269]|uniref:Polyprenyl synthetase family protein n=1 Tax=Candidatus Clostridium eludens TaxID=3381663 RepID=A0ABW8SLK7_9CLOT